MNDLKIAAAYIRVSTDDQIELSPDSQIKTVRDFAKQRGYLIPKEYIFRDDGISGRNASKRPEFNRMIATAKTSPTPFSAIMVWKFSRFARNQEEAIFYKGMLKKRGIDVISTSEPIIEGPFGSLIERIIEWFDEYYSINLSTEVKRGMTEKVSRGGAVSIPAFGYDIVDKKYIINNTTAPIIRRIYSDYLGGKGCSVIARELNDMGIRTSRGNLWENRTVEYILYNPVYIGKIRWNPKRRTRRNYNDKDIMIVDGQHQPIISEEMFNMVQDKLAEDKKTNQKYVTDRKNGKDYMLRGLVKCSSCGATLSFGGNGLQCINYLHSRCNESHYISLNKINQMFLLGLSQAFKTGNLNIVERKNLEIEEEVIDIDMLIEKENKKLQRVKEAYEDGVYNLSEFKQSKEKIQKQITNLLSQKKPTESKSEDNIEVAKQKLIKQHKNTIEQLTSNTLTEKEKNTLLKSFVEKVVFDRKNSSLEVFFYSPL